MRKIIISSFDILTVSLKWMESGQHTAVSALAPHLAALAIKFAPDHVQTHLPGTVANIVMEVVLTSQPVIPIHVQVSLI